jgi:hypothetical protein
VPDLCALRDLRRLHADGAVACPRVRGVHGATGRGPAGVGGRHLHDPHAAALQSHAHHGEWCGASSEAACAARKGAIGILETLQGIDTTNVAQYERLLSSPWHAQICLHIAHIFLMLFLPLAHGNQHPR